MIYFFDFKSPFIHHCCDELEEQNNLFHHKCSFDFVQKQFDRLNISLFESEQFSPDEKGVHDIKKIFNNSFSIQQA